MLYPTTLDVLASHESATLCPEDELVPSPENDCCRDVSVALLVNAIFPDAVPAAAGVNVTVYFVLCPAVIVTGKVMPLTAYPEPFQAADEMVTSAVVAERVPVKDAVLPTATFPKLSEEGDTANVPSEGGFTTT